MDSYLGVLRISSDDGVLSTEKQYICDSDGHASSIALTERETHLENKVVFGVEGDSAVLSGGISSGVLTGDNFTISTEGKVSLSFSPARKEDGIYITSPTNSVTSPLVSFTSDGTTFNGDTFLKGKTTLNGTKPHTIKTNNGDVTLNLKSCPASSVLQVNKEGNCISFGSISQMIEDKVKQYIGETGTEKNNLVPVGSVIYITLPSYDYFRINLKNLSTILRDNFSEIKEFVDTYDDNKGAGYSMIGASKVLNGYLEGTCAKQYQLHVVEHADIEVESWYTGHYEKDEETGKYYVRDVSYLDGIDISKPETQGDSAQMFFNECICAVSGLELRMPKQYLGYWDFCLGQSETSFNDPIDAAGGHTSYTKDKFPQLWQVLRPLDDDSTDTDGAFCLPNFGYDFIRCAGQDPHHGQASKVIVQSISNPNNSSTTNPSDAKVLPFGDTIENGDSYNNMMKYDQHLAPIITEHDEPTTIVYQEGDSYVPHVGRQQLTDFRGLSNGMRRELSKKTSGGDGSFCLYTYIPPDVFGKVGLLEDEYKPTGCISYANKKVRYGRVASDSNQFTTMTVSRLRMDFGEITSISSLNNWLNTAIFRRENKPRSSVLIPIIKIRDMS